MANTPETVKLLGGTLCLDFANSVDWTAHGELWKDEVLKTPRDLARWGERLGLGRSARGREDELAAALRLRTSLHAVFAAIAAGRAPAATDLQRIAVDHTEAAGAARLARDDDGAWRLTWPARDPRRVRFAVAVDAVALLADRERLARVRHCAGHNCGWLFIDASGRRRWCTMETCGSRAKMRRLYERRRAATA
jgi:predicted RNA-binding Zn ribbon-like protein